MLLDIQFNCLANVVLSNWGIGVLRKTQAYQIQMTIARLVASFTRLRTSACGTMRLCWDLCMRRHPHPVFQLIAICRVQIKSRCIMFSWVCMSLGKSIAFWFIDVKRFQALFTDASTSSGNSPRFLRFPQDIMS